MSRHGTKMDGWTSGERTKGNYRKTDILYKSRLSKRRWRLEVGTTEDYIIMKIRDNLPSASTKLADSSESLETAKIH